MSNFWGAYHIHSTLFLLAKKRKELCPIKSDTAPWGEYKSFSDDASYRTCRRTCRHLCAWVCVHARARLGVLMSVYL